MRPLCVIQARLGSRRLPTKVLYPLGEENVLAWVIRRTKRTELPVVVVAPECDVSVLSITTDLCGVPIMAGLKDDVLSRYAAAAIKFEAHPIIRITGDCPLIFPELIEVVLSQYENMGSYLLSGQFAIKDREIKVGSGFSEIVSLAVGPRAQKLGINAWPDGTDVEVMGRGALLHTNIHADSQEDREHVTGYMWDRPEIFLGKMIECERDCSKIKFSIDTMDDYLLVQEIVSAFGDISLDRLPELCDWISLRCQTVALAPPDTLN